MDNGRKKLGWSFWVPLAMVVGYPLSVGPVGYLIWNVKFPAPVHDAVADFYHPLSHRYTPAPVKILTKKYVALWVDLARPPATPRTEEKWCSWFEFEHVVEGAGLVLAGWLIYSLVRWLNSRQTPRPASLAARGP
jgi:hypothetical protein